ncbi:MAG TPA: iron-containing alcohol dehydrogenase, partial [Candidatus Lambdaproteobacteria bacterium]|nr:iron-containing alcohol dehydrogenase [Candidatus Lambdaproteobacteria bacterium]
MSFSSYFTHKSGGDRIFSVEAPKIKFGRGSLQEVGDDAKALGMKRVVVFTDPRVGQMEHVSKVVESLKSQGLDAVVF